MTRGLSLLLQLCRNGRSLSSARGTELYNLHSSVPLALLLQLCQNGRSLSSARGTELYNLHSSVPLSVIAD
uniref:SFRICE_039784 n=1 Tax=Spodoptera frugiperda TaxID=7108 RepID=A0A2H1X239_SPOFR